jgi:uncharacterized damage-inducible protein DinB
MANADDAVVRAALDSSDTRSALHLIAAYRGGAPLLQAAVAGMSTEQLLARPIEGKYSTQEVVCHVADCDQFLADRMKRTIAMDRPLLVGADGFRYPAALGYQERDLGLDLRLLAVTREQMAADLDRVADDAWERTAIHTETGLVTLRQLLLHSIRHLERHVDAISEKRVALGLPPA